MADIVLDRVSKSFGKVRVIDDLSLKVNSGEFVVFLGPSGSGKSTLLRMIAGLETIDSGRLEIGGRESQALAPGQRDVAMVFQNYALYPHMTVRDNMVFGLKNVGMGAGEIKRRVEEAARMLEMDALLDRRPSQLSGGQRQRVAIGRAIVKEPAAYLFDEPLSNLDAALRVRTRVELAELHQRIGTTMIYVTHDQTEAMTMADRIVILNDCKIEQVGTPMEVYSAPASRFVAGFIGSPAMNFVPVTVEARGETSLASFGGVSQIELPVAVRSGGKFDLGIRPEAVTVVADGGTVTARTKVVEHLGDRTFVYATLSDGSEVIAQDSGRSTILAGDEVGLSFDVGQVHLFAEDGSVHRAAGIG